MSSKAEASEGKRNDDKDDVFIIDDDCDEDVPGDFFDDFLKEDFMAGLDIVDDDQWENGAMKKDDKIDSTKENKEKTNTTKELEDKNKSKRRRSKRDKLPPRRERGKGIDADEFDIRRDPNKTKRDIQRDKVKCEKDKEKKLITEKLKLVETGLVPPGMEMEVDISEIENNNEEPKKPGSKIESPPKRRRSRVRSISPRRRATSPRRRSRNRSPKRISPRRSPRRSPIRRKSRERISRERRSRERSIERTLRSIRRSRSGSLYRDRRPRYSPDYSRRRRRTRSRSRDKKKETKKSFLQEIVEKLRETRPSNNVLSSNQYMPPGPHMQPGPRHLQPGPPHLQPSPHIQPGPSHMQHLTPSGLPIQPAPVPAPTFPVINPQQGPPQVSGPSQNQYDPYDQSFFIGTPLQSGSFVPPNEQVSSMVNYRQGSIQKAGDGVSTNSGSAGVHKKIDIPEQEVGKLFHDKKISLSEFLAITAKPEVCSGSPVQLRDKIKVLSRCHDAIKILEAEEKKFQGPFQLRKTVKQQSAEDKYKSPLVKISEAKVSFTEIPTKGKNKSVFTMHLNNLLQGIGLLDEVVELDDDPEPIISSYVPKGTSPPPPPHISRQKHTRNDDNIVRIHNENTLSKMIQTEPMPKCSDCEKRRKIVYKTSGCQTGDLMTYSVSTQVTEDDLFTKIPKSQSLASLTPAQLLAQNAVSSSSKRYGDSDEFDIFPPKISYNRGSFDYARAAESYSSSSGTLNSRFFPSERDRDEPPNNSMFSGARGRGPPNNFDAGPRYSYY